MAFLWRGMLCGMITKDFPEEILQSEGFLWKGVSGIFGKNSNHGHQVNPKNHSSDNYKIAYLRLNKVGWFVTPGNA